MLTCLEATEHVPRERVVLVGRSLGTGVATEMARRGHGSRLILISPYTSLPEVAKGIVPFWVPVGLLMRDRFPTAERAPSVVIPVLIIHGTDDEVIPFAMGEHLASVFPHARLRQVEHAGHNDLFESAPELRGEIVDFATRLDPLAR